MLVQFELPAALSAEKFITRLTQYADSQLTARRHTEKIFYDSFDWRLYAKGWVGEAVSANHAGSFYLRELAGGKVLACAGIDAVPPFAKQFRQAELREVLGQVLEMRALLAVCTLPFEEFHVNVINKDEKTVARLTVEDYAQLQCRRVILQPIKGYQKNAEQLVTFLTDQLAATPVERSLLDTALTWLGRRPRDYSAKLAINLAPSMRADIASKYIYSYLLKIIKDNEQGVIAAIDSEFLHDFRVAIRKTRTGLSQLKGVLPEVRRSEFGVFFSWLGQITGPTRDFDVYLLNFDAYRESLPVSVRPDLDPLLTFLQGKQQKSQRELAKKLKSDQYSQGMAAWGQFLREGCAQYPLEPGARLTIKQLADLRIWKIYKRVVREGNAITVDSAPEVLHELRKTCKKLRYLMEFFDSLYPQRELKPLLNHLKALQEVLGCYQDYQVQEDHLRQFGLEMQANQTPANTLMAMGMLIQHLDGAKQQVREHFAEAFKSFRTEENHKGFKKLFANRGAEDSA